MRKRAKSTDDWDDGEEKRSPKDSDQTIDRRPF